jgi:hypothetical protein
MARIRTIKPEFWISDQITECSPIARLMFIGLWTFADDAGRMPFSVKRIKKQIFPADDISSSSIQGMIDELSSNALIEIYDVEDKQYLEITGWHHQRIDRPTYQFPDRKGRNHGNAGFDARRTIHEVSTPESKGVYRKGKESKGVESKGVEKESTGASHPKTRARASPLRNGKNGADDWPADYCERFEAAYPHKVGMAPALEALEATRLGGKVSFEFLIAAIADYARSKPADQKWVNPKRWLDEERWNDRPATHKNNGGGGGDIARDLARELEARERAQALGGAADAVGGAELGGEHARLVPRQK